MTTWILFCVFSTLLAAYSDVPGASNIGTPILKDKDSKEAHAFSLFAFKEGGVDLGCIFRIFGENSQYFPPNFSSDITKTKFCPIPSNKPAVMTSIKFPNTKPR